MISLFGRNDSNRLIGPFPGYTDTTGVPDDQRTDAASADCSEYCCVLRRCLRRGQGVARLLEQQGEIAAHVLGRSRFNASLDKARTHYQAADRNKSYCFSHPVLSARSGFMKSYRRHSTTPLAAKQAMPGQIGSSTSAHQVMPLNSNAEARMVRSRRCALSCSSRRSSSTPSFFTLTR